MFCFHHQSCIASFLKFTSVCLVVFFLNGYVFISALGLILSELMFQHLLNIIFIIKNVADKNTFKYFLYLKVHAL